MSKTRQLRAVGYCRTSGESQRDNTSIPRQRSAIEATCKANGWKFVRHYVDECRSGAKTEGRDEFRRMIQDAAGGEFDVIVPFDVTRFGRDGVDIVATAKLLRSEFAVLTIDSKGGFDNRDHRNALRNYVQAGVSEHERLTIMERMIGGKIARAKDNIPTNGRLPFARTYDRETGEWGVDAEKVEAIREVAERILVGESLRRVAEEFQWLTYPQLNKVLRHGCGDKWELRYRVEELGLEETVVHTVPRLLPEATIKAVHRRLDENRRFLRNSPAKHDYLLGGHVFCAECGFKMTGAVRPSGVRLYRHNFRKNADCPLRPRPSVRADDLEQAVVRDLFEMLGNPAAIERAVRQAVPEGGKLRKDRDRAEEKLAKVQSERDKIVRRMCEETLSEDDAARYLRDLKDREARLRERRDFLDSQLADAPDPEAVRSWVEEAGDSLFVVDEHGNTYSGGNDVQSFIDMHRNGRDDLRQLVRSAFKGPTEGVYVTPAGGSYAGPKQFAYELRGRLFVGSPRGARLAPSCGRR